MMRKLMASPRHPIQLTQIKAGVVSQKIGDVTVCATLAR
jgi:hypothetical protein